MGQEHRTFRMRGEGKRMEMNLHATNAPPRRHLLKERLIRLTAFDTLLFITMEYKVHPWR
jgi:hypothetical protein